MGDFLAWCESRGVTSLPHVQPLHVASWIEMQGRELAAPTVKQHLAAIRHLFDWLVTGQIMPVNPAASVRGPRHVVRSGNFHEVSKLGATTSQSTSVTPMRLAKSMTEG